MKPNKALANRLISWTIKWILYRRIQKIFIWRHYRAISLNLFVRQAVADVIADALTGFFTLQISSVILIPHCRASGGDCHHHVAVSGKVVASALLGNCLAATKITGEWGKCLTWCAEPDSTSKGMRAWEISAFPKTILNTQY